ncbi:MAG: ABC transporter ATP-binding protein [Treponema sp.]|jgi:oligopeptide/dipeptide ABC transporter ATP-binding protein|nr:ABC transporter ATP-binding protein [Treponema sp.]
MNNLITVSNLKKRFNLEAGFFSRFGKFVYAVNDVSFSIDKNESYGLVGESGCGKTTTARLLVRMYEADEGKIIFNESEALRAAYEGLSPNDRPVSEEKYASIDVRSLGKKELRRYREKVKYVFQDPARSLNPRMSVYEVLVSGSRFSLMRKGTHQTEKQLKGSAAAILEEVGLGKDDLDRRPAEFSGGQRQRISIARGLLMQPELLICDEVVSALDVSIQGQILNLLLDIREKRNLSFLFIAHDLKVACYFCDRIGVMYRGELMEEAPAADLYKRGLHPYTELLFSSAAGLPAIAKAKFLKDENQVNTETTRIETGKIDTTTQSTGCAFAGRCKFAGKRCFIEHPDMREIEKGHKIRCFRV